MRQLSGSSSEVQNFPFLIRLSMTRSDLVCGRRNRHGLASRFFFGRVCSLHFRCGRSLRVVFSVALPLFLADFSPAVDCFILVGCTPRLSTLAEWVARRAEN